MSEFDSLPALPWSVPDSVMQKAAALKLAIFDVDGVLTDGSLHYGADGEELKRFHALDGHGLKLLRSAGVEVGIISARQSGALITRMKDLGITHTYLGISDKVQAFETLLTKLDIDAQNVVFTGDDVIDLPVMQLCGLKFSVNNGHFIVQSMADWVTPQAGGAGAVRAVCDTILYSKRIYPLHTKANQ